MKTEKLLSYLQLKKISGDVPETITGIEIDSRKVNKGNIFVCVQGYTVDGHDYIKDAIENGASVVICQKEVRKIDGICIIKVKDTNRAVSILANVYYDFPSKKLNIIGITGTNGKTTISSAIHQLLIEGGVKAGLSGTNGINYNGTVEGSTNTTNDALTIQKMLKRMKDEGITDVVMEVSSHGLTLGRLWGVEFQQAIFTNLTQDHLDFHGTMENYKQAKGLLFSQLGQDISKNKTAVLNVDDSASEYFESITSAKVITYGIEKEADYMATDIKMNSEFTSFILKSNQGEHHVKTPFVGKFNIYNLLSVIVSMVESGQSLEKVIGRLEGVRPVDGRMERVINDKNRAIFVDYAHTPDGIEKVLQSVRGFTKGKVIIVFGTGGNRDASKRPIMAEKASTYADTVIVTTDNPRFEDPKEIMKDIIKGLKHEEYVAIEDRRTAIAYAVKQSSEEDVIIIAGKGHETYQIIGDIKYPFSDVEETKIALKTL